MDLPPCNNQEYTLETREASPAHLLTKMKPFSMLSKHEIARIESMDFHSGDYKWKVVMNLDEDEHISAALSMVGTNSLPAGWEVNAIFNFFLYNHVFDKYLCFRGKARRFNAINHIIGFSKLITKNNFMEPSNGYIYNDKCVFGAEVFVITKKPLIQRVSVYNLTTPFKHEWYIPNFSKLERVWNSEVFSAAGYKWQVMMFPNGIAKTSGLYVGVHLVCVDPKSIGINKRLSVACVFCFGYHINVKKRHTTRATMLYTSTAPSWGINDFVAISDVRDPGKGLVVDNCCILEILLSLQALHEEAVPYIAGAKIGSSKDQFANENGNLRILFGCLANFLNMD